MKNSWKLAMSFVKKQKAKTIALLACVVLAVMLIFSMTVIRDSGYESEIKEAKNLYGDYHIMFEELDDNKIKDIKKEKGILKINHSKDLCKIIDKKSGVLLDLNVFDKGFIDSFGYKFEGREPKRDGEIVLEKEAVNQMGIDNILNKNINMMLSQDYTDENGISHMDSENKSFKVVGLIQRPTKYYSNSSYGIEFRAFTHKGIKTKMNFKNTYSGTIYLKHSENISKFVEKMLNNLGTTSIKLHENGEVDLAKSHKVASEESNENIINLLMLFFVSITVIYNIFNIIFQDMINQIGLMRSVGMSKKQVNYIFLFMSLIYIILGTIIGIVLGIVFSYISLKIIYQYNSVLKINLYSVISSFMVSIVSILISISILIFKCRNMSIIQTLKSSEKFKIKSNSKKGIVKHKNLVLKIATKNLGRNKSRTILTILTITLVGTMFVLNLGARDFRDSNMAQGITGGIWSMSYGSVDKTIEGGSTCTDYLFYKVDKNLINKLNSINEVKYIEPHYYNPYGKILITKNNLSKEYAEELERIDSIDQINYKNEYPLLIRGYSNEMLSKREQFIDKGKNILTPSQGDIKKVILVNNTYSKLTNSFTNVINDVKVGDILDVKIPVYDTNVEKYKNFKVEVKAIMKESYASGQDGNTQANGVQLIFREDDYKNLTGQNEYNKVFISVKDGKLHSVEKELKSLTKNYSSLQINGKGEELKFIGQQQTSEDKLSVIYQILILLILSVNVIFIMRSNIIVRKKELAVLRAIGMSVKNIQKMLIIESQLYGLISATLGSLIATIYYNYQIFKLNQAFIAGGFSRLAKYNIPINQIVIFFSVFILIGFIAIYISKDKFKGISIVELISKED